MAAYKLLNIAMKRDISVPIFYIRCCKTFTRGFRVPREIYFRGRRVQPTIEETMKKKLLEQAPNVENPVIEIPKTRCKDADDNDFFGIHSDSGAIIIPPQTVKTTKSGIKKFDYLLKSETSSPSDGERTFVTTFGAVRFDSDNTPSHSKSKEVLDPWETIGGPNSIKKFFSLFYPTGQTDDEFQSLPADTNQNSKHSYQQINEINNDECHSEVLRSDRPNFIKGELSEKSQESNKNAQNERYICSFEDEFQNCKCTSANIKKENMGIEGAASGAVGNLSISSNNISQEISETCNFIEDIYFENNATNPKENENDACVDMYNQTKKESLSYIDDIYFGELCNSKTCEDLSNGSKENEAKDAEILNSSSDLQENNDIHELAGEIKGQNFIDALYFGKHTKETPHADFKAKKVVTEENVMELNNLADKKGDESVTSNFSASVIQPFLKQGEVSFSDTRFSNQKGRLKDPFINEESCNKLLPMFDRQIPKLSEHLENTEKEKYVLSVSEGLKSREIDNEEERCVKHRSFIETDHVNHSASNVTETFDVSKISSTIELPASKFVSKNKPIKNENEVPKDTTKSSNISNNSRSNYENQNSAYNYVLKLKNDDQTTTSNETKGVNVNVSGEKLDSKGFRILRNQVPDLSNHTRLELLDMMKERILFSNDDIVILDKPYNLIIHESQTTSKPSLSSFLSELARELDKSSENPQLYTIHRLDKETTGCLLLARNEHTAVTLKSLFANRKIFKIYWIVTTKVPDPCEGTIDMPIAEGKIDGKRRMVLQPDLPADIKYKSHVRNGKKAITHYKVIATSRSAALIEVKPETGLKHQIRVHFGFGMGCPILGDHKYSHLDKLAPQRLPNDILQTLHVRQSKVRHIPMHIHSKAIVIPDYFEKGRDLYVTAPLPKHMQSNLKRLKFSKK